MQIPAIHLTDLQEKDYIFSTLIATDKLNLILFYNTHCLGCTGRAIPLAYALHKEYQFLNLIMIHSNFRKTEFTKKEVLSVFTDQNSPLEIYREPFHELYDYFACEGTPHWVLLDDQQKVLHSIFGSQDGAQMKLQYAIDEFKSRFS